MIKDKVKDTIVKNNLIEHGEHIVIGLSGGPDSVCLFHILQSLKEEWDLGIDAVHINHGLRPGAAEQDQKYTEDLCKSYHVPCHTFIYDVKKIAAETGASSEDAGRQVRYQSFALVAEKIACETGKTVKIAVAQNMNDQAETVLMRILRGTGTEGLCGIEYLRNDPDRGTLIRPLLDITREEIEAYCCEHKLEPQIDLTNLEPLYTRNKIRLELLPYLSEQFNPNITTVLNRLSAIAKEDKAYFSGKVNVLIEEHAEFGSNSVRMSVNLLKELEPALRHRVVKGLFERIGLVRDMGSVHLEQADELLIEGKTSASTDFPMGYGMRIQYGKVEFYKKAKTEKNSFEYEININKEGKIQISELNAEIGVKILSRQNWVSWRKKEKFGGNNEICSLSLEKLMASQVTPILRTRKPGDYIVPFGMRGRKKLQDFFVDAKIDKLDRDRIPIVSIGAEVIWIVGSRTSENFKVEDATEQIIVLEYCTKT
ncbi:tRNA lysidine(34) synthetase TilS [Anoxybacterium hadale]|uniref:tRNA lysidine(34) synthetase TilS n=1 Tax=Anoxybacterium hadale TaxID=3408580 RepID=A0ACD1AFX2_9FIRM|nr:tRNA lysidine(34) synthetase TilS [Clostridiales bacterium]